MKRERMVRGIGREEANEREGRQGDESKCVEGERVRAIAIAVDLQRRYYLWKDYRKEQPQ